MNRKRILISIFIVAVLAAGGYWAYLQFLAPEPDVETDIVPDVNTISIDTGSDNVAAEGEVVPLAHTALAPQIGGEVIELLVAEGDAVQAGDPLLRLDAQDQETALQQAETAVLQAEAALNTAQAGLAAAQVGLDAANVAVAAAEAELALLTAEPTPEQIALQEALVAAAAAGVQQAGGNQALVLEGAGAAQIGAAEAELAAAQAQLFAVRLVNEPVAQNEEADATDREQAQLRLNAAIAGVAAAQARLDELNAGATRAEQVAAFGAVSAAVGQRDAANAQLDLLLAGTRQESIAVAEANVEQTRLAVTDAEFAVTRAETAVTQAEAGVAEAETAVAAATAALDLMTLTAPFGGVVARIDVKEGEVASAGFPIITLADFSEWRIETTDLTELNVVSIKVGDDVNISVDAFPGVRLGGRITDIAATSEVTRGDVTYAVTITPEETDLPLRWGMTAFVTVGDEPGTAVAATDSDSPIIETIFAEGALEPLSIAQLSFPVGGEISEIMVAEGDTVGAGDPLLRLDTTNATIALQQAEARLQTAEAGLVAANAQLLQVQTGVATAAGQVTVANARLALVESGPLPEEIAAAEASIAAAEAGVTQAIGNRDAALDITTDAAVRAAEANVAAATADVRVLEEQYDTILTTCFETPDGEVCPLYGPVEESVRAQLAAARAGQTAAQAALDQLLAGPTQGQRAAAGGGVALATANVDVAEAQLDLLLAGATPEQIAQVEVGVFQAELGVARAEVSVTDAEAAVARAEAEVMAAQVGIAAAQAALDRLTLTAAFAGVVARIDVNPGEIAAAGRSVVTLADFGGWQVRTTDLTELDVARIEIGSEVEVGLDAIPDARVAGTVTAVALTPGLSQGDVVYEVTIRLAAAPDLPLRWGMTAFIETNS